MQKTFLREQNTSKFLQENVYENAFCNMSSILFMIQYLKTLSALEIFVNVKKYNHPSHFSPCIINSNAPYIIP